MDRDELEQRIDKLDQMLEKIPGVEEAMEKKLQIQLGKTKVKEREKRVREN